MTTAGCAGRESSLPTQFSGFGNNVRICPSHLLERKSMDIVTAAKKRYSTKAYDPNRRVPEEIMQQIYEVLRFSPSSVNSQPWHFIVASTPEAKARMAKGAQGGFSYNEPKILNASHVILFCVRADADQQHLDNILEQEQRDGRFRDEAAKAGQAKG